MARTKSKPTVEDVITLFEQLEFVDQVKGFNEIREKLKAKKKEAEEAVKELTSALED